MKALLKYLKLGGIFLGIIIIISFILSLLNYLGLSNNLSSIINILLMVILFLAMGILEGLNAQKKGYLAGFKIGLILIGLILIINLVFFQSSINVSRMIYYLILLFSSVFGSMIGINRKKKE